MYQGLFLSAVLGRVGVPFDSVLRALKQF